MSISTLLPALHTALHSQGFNLTADATNPAPGETLGLLSHDRTTLTPHPQTTATIAESTYTYTAIHAPLTYDTTAAQAHLLTTVDNLLASLPTLQAQLSTTHKILRITIADATTDLDDSAGELEAQLSTTLTISHLLNH